jgi:hypothetical protein
MASSRLLIALVVATLGLAAAPGVAMATHNNDFADATEITEDQLFDGYADDNDNVGADEETGEVLDCGNSDFGKTLWWTFVAPADGYIDITTRGIDSVIWVVPVSGGYDAEDAACTDTVVENENLFSYVFEGEQYYIQVGGFDDGSGAEEGNLDLEAQFFIDSDSDRRPDVLDECPAEPGVNNDELDGCPDGDGDNIRNSQDNCPSVPGLAKFGGCPDADDDGVPEPPDACPGVKGDLANGCKRPPPCPNGDGDNVCDDGPDKCVGENSRARDANDNGCLDLQLMNPRWIFKPDSYFTRRGGRVVLLGLQIERFGVRNVPKGARVVVTCSRRACRRMSKRARSRVVFGRLSGDNFRAGVKLRIRVTAPGYVGAARVYTIQRNDYVRTDRCLMPGSPKLRTSCSPVR